MLSLVLVILSALAFSNALPVPGKELIYNYRAKIGVGTNEPIPYASQFYLEGKLHLQYEAKDSVLVRFTDLTFRLYNGELNQRNEYESKSLPVPQETADLLKVFRIEYNETGKVQAITTESGERRYARNIKKAIASILQLDLQKILANANKPNAFISEERSIYGRGLVEYNVIPEGDVIVVQKMQDVKSSRRWYSYFGINAEPQYTGVPIESPVSIDSHKQYTLVRTDNNLYIKRLDAHGGIYVHPYSGLYGSQQVQVNQTLELLETIPVEKNYNINNGERTDQLEFGFERETQTGTLDISIDRHRANKEENIRLVQRLLEGVITYLESNQLTLDAPNIMQGQSINELNRVITFLDIPTLEQILTQLKEKTEIRDQKTLQIFLKVIPLVGTRATTVFVRNLVRERKVDDQIAIELLNKLSFYLRQPSEKLLIEVEDLLDLGDTVNPEVRRTGVLTFASLIHKVFAHKSWLERNHEHLHVDNHDHLTYHYPGNWNSYHVHAQHPHDEHVQDNTSGGTTNEIQLLERYILRIVNLLKSSQDYLSQYLYMQALYNIQVGNVAKYLEPYVKGEVENVNSHLRFLAMLASFAGTVNNPEKVFSTYWPILTNRKLHLDLRTAAYVIIMYTRPTMSKWWNIYWFMQTEQCPELYNFYYTHLQSLAATQDPLLQDHKLHTQQILKFVRKPYKPSVSGNYIHDYKDPKFGYGVTVQSMYVSTKTSKTLLVDLTNHVQNVPFHYYSLYLKIDGLDASVAAKLSNEKVLHVDSPELQELLKLIASLQDQKNLHVEYAIMNYNQVVKIGYYDNTNINNLVDSIRNIQIENNRLLQNSLEIQYNLLSQLVLPNDLGLPTIVQIKFPNVRNNIFKITREVINKVTNIQGEVRLQNSMQNTQEMKIYNPILDVWQGVNRIRSYDSVIPLKFNLAINTQQHSLKLTLNNLQSEEKGTAGLRSYISTNTFIGDDINQYLKQSNGKCSNVEEIIRGKQNRKTYTLYDLDDENTGLRYQVALLNSERQLSRKDIRDFIVSITQSGNRNIEDSNLVQNLLSLRNLWTRIALLPNDEISGIIIRAVPNIRNQISHIDLSLRYNQEINRDEGIQLPSAKLNTRATYSIKEGERVLKTWDVNAIIELNAAHTVNNVKVQITKIVPDEKDYKICIDGIKKWIGTGVTGHLSITAGRSPDGKCAKDEALVDINMRGDRGQLKNNEKRVNVPAQLLYIPKLNDQQVLGYRTVENLLENTNILRYVYDIKTTRIPDNVLHWLHQSLNVIERVYNPYIVQENTQTQIAGNNVQVIVEYPVVGNQVNLQVINPQQTYNISGIQLSDLYKHGLQPDNYLLSRKFLRLYSLGLTQSCLINQQLILNGQNSVINSVIGNDWLKVVSNAVENPTLDVSVRRLDEQKNLLALRVIQKSQEIEVVPGDDQIQVKINGQQANLDNGTLRQEDWYSLGRLNDDQGTILLHIYKYGLYISVNRDSIQLDAPKYVSGLIGQCISS
ncbi:crossveinless d [Carabus blaptoides fortunei]